MIMFPCRLHRKGSLTYCDKMWSFQPEDDMMTKSGSRQILLTQLFVKTHTKKFEFKEYLLIIKAQRYISNTELILYHK